MVPNKFSDSVEYALNKAEITIRNDAPSELRNAIIHIAFDCGFTAERLREIICNELREMPERGINWSEESIKSETINLIDNCQWYKIYDIIERIYRATPSAPFSPSAGHVIPHQETGATNMFEKYINEYFIEHGIGWQLIDGKIETRGEDIFERDVRGAIDLLNDSGKTTASNELHKALDDLSRRPAPDITGAITHSMAALECVARSVTGNNDTLGSLIQKNKELFPKPLDSAVEKIWGYASNQARHLSEGKEPDYNEAALTVSISGALIGYLSKKFKDLT